MSGYNQRFRSHRRRGVTFVLTGISLFMMLGFAALTIDVGLGQMVRNELQRTADSAALAAVQDLVGNDIEKAMQRARASAAKFVGLNQVLNGRDVDFQVTEDLTFGRATMNETLTGILFDPDVFPPNAVNVFVSYELDYTFAHIFGLGSREISASAMSVLPPPKMAEIIPIALPVPGFGPIDPDIADHNPGKTGPSEPTAENEFKFVPGEEVAIFIFGNGPMSPVHLVLDYEAGEGASDLDRLLAAEGTLGGEREAFEVEIGDEILVFNDGTGNANFGDKLYTRLENADPYDDTVILPVVEEIEGETRDADGKLIGMVRVVDFMAVTLTEIRYVDIPDPNRPDKTMTIKVLYGEVVGPAEGNGNGFGTTSGNFTFGSVTGSPMLIM